MPTLNQCQRVYDHLEPELRSDIVLNGDGDVFRVKEVGEFSVTLIDKHGVDIIIDRSEFHENCEAEL